MKYALTIVALRAIALAGTVALVGSERLTRLGPLFAVCMVASVLTGRRAQGRGE